MATVLLIEPHADSARTYSETLQRAGFQVERATSEAERQDLAPDILVISVRQVERSPLRVVAHGRPVPRIVLSAQPGDASRAAEFDCASVLIQPVMYDDLVNEVRRVLKTAAAAQLV